MAREGHKNERLVQYEEMIRQMVGLILLSCALQLSRWNHVTDHGKCPDLEVRQTDNQEASPHSFDKSLVIASLHDAKKLEALLALMYILVSSSHRNKSQGRIPATFK
jgi:hypothetical protein